MINLKIMQEKENIGRRLQKLQEQCVNDYLQSRLQTITSQEVIKEIIEGFIAMNNEQFFQSIAETIHAVKQENKQLAEDMQTLKSKHAVEMEELTLKMQQGEQLQEKIRMQCSRDLQEKVRQLTSVIEQKQSERKNLLKTVEDEKNSKTQIHKLLTQKQQALAQTQSKLTQMTKENNKLVIEVEKTKESGIKFKESCEKILKDANKEKEKQKEKLIESWNLQRQAMQNQIKQLQAYLQSKQKEWQERSYLQKQQKDGVIENLRSEITTISQKLSLSQAELLTKIAQIEHLTAENHQWQDRIKGIGDNLQKVEKEKQSLHVSNLYLQEQNNYLRNEIISFDTRYKQLEQEKATLEKAFQRFKTQKNRELQEKQRALQQLQLQNRQVIQKITEQTSTSLKEITAELQFLKQREQIYRETQNKLVSRQQQLQTLLSNCQEENKCMTEQLQLHFADNQLHEKQVQLYEESIIKLNQDFRAQLQARKQSYENSWKSLNQEMLEEKYKSSVLREQIEKAREEISLFHEKEQVYELYHMEIAQLKAQLALISSSDAKTKSKQDFLKGDYKNTIYFLASRANQETKKLKRQNKYLRQSVIKLISQQRDYIQQMLTVAVLKIRQQSLKCCLCEHQKTLKITEKTSNQQIMFKKTMPKLASSEGVNYSTIKKALKSINQRCEALNHQNKHYTDHISGVLNRI